MDLVGGPQSPGRGNTGGLTSAEAEIQALRERALQRYALQYPSTDVGGRAYFERVGSTKTKRKYSSADCAAYLELDAELPDYIRKEKCRQS